MRKGMKIIGVAYHRNGVGGAGFYAVLFKWNHMTMIASVFDAPRHVAVYSVEELDALNYGVGNKWRGDDFERDLRKAIADYEASRAAYSA